MRPDSGDDFRCCRDCCLDFWKWHHPQPIGWAKDSSGSMPVVHAAAAPAMYFRIVRRFCTLRLSCGSEAADGRKRGVFRTDVQDVFWLEAQKLERFLLFGKLPMWGII